MSYTQTESYYAPAMVAHPKYAAAQRPSASRQSSSSQREVLPNTLSFTDASTLLTFMSSLASPSQLLSVTTLHISLPSSSSLARSQVGQVAMGVHLLLRYVHNLTALHLSWADAPSSVLTGTSFRLHTFASNMYVDGTVIQFLEAQTSIRTLELGAWGAHLPPSSSSYNGMQYPPAPPMLAPTALPALAEFTGHAEVAAQLAAGGRPIQAVHLISGLPSTASGASSSVVTQEWREIMRGLSASPMGVRSLSVVGIEHFGLEMLAEIGRHLHDLDYLFLRVQRPASASDVFRFEHWKNYLLPLANLEQIDIELFDSTSSSQYSSPVTLPSVAHIQQWHNTCPLLSNVTVSNASASRGRTQELCAWEWANLRWVDRVARR